MVRLSAYMGFDKCLDDLFLLGRDRKLSESCGILASVLDTGSADSAAQAISPVVPLAGQQ